jgi:hypothetical protein
MQIVYGTYNLIKLASVRVNLNSTADILAVFPQLRSNVEEVSIECEESIEMRNQVVIKKCK